MESSKVDEFAKRLHDARLGHYEVEKLSAETQDFSVENAYRIQERGIELRLAEGCLLYTSPSPRDS